MDMSLILRDLSLGLTRKSERQKESKIFVSLNNFVPGNFNHRDKQLKFCLPR